MENRFHFKIGGLAGEGIMVTGLIFSKFAARSGFQVFDFVEYPSLIRGGHNTYYGTISQEEVFSSHNRVDLLIALNQETVDFHQGELNPGAGIIFDPNEFSLSPIKDAKLFPIPLTKLAEKAGGKIMANTVALGAMVYLVGGELEILNSVLKDIFSDKKQEIIANNLQAAKLGFEFAKDKFTPLTNFLSFRETGRQLLIAGNEAIALGAIAAGVKFAAVYPMTPISSILTFLALHEKEAGIVFRQPEDEIAGINLALGASFAGVRSLVATSGGGFALMNEALSMAGISETPLVVIFGQRAGPATGLPTWTAQEDLLYALTAAHGEYPRIVLAPGDVEECFYLTAEAFNLAEFYQTPVIILVDKFVCEGHKSISPFELRKVKIERGKLQAPNSPAFAAPSPKLGSVGDKASAGRQLSTPDSIFPRYQLSTDGISTRAFPEKRVIVKANSDEHDEFGLDNESSENRILQVQKRMKKLEILTRKLREPTLYGPKEADLTLVGWGSTKGPILEAMSNSPEEKVNFLHLNWLAPFPAESVNRILKRARKTLLIENNYQGQLGRLIKMETGLEIKNKFLKYDGRQFYPEEIRDKIKSLI